MGKLSQPERITLSITEVDEIYQRLRGLERALAAHDLTLFALMLLRSVAVDPDASLGVSALALGAEPSVVSGGMKRLEQRGLAERLGRHGIGASPDRRHVRVRVTARGQALLDELTAIEIEL